jgi:hypothetical protein
LQLTFPLFELKISALKLSIIQAVAFKTALELPGRTPQKPGIFGNLKTGPASLALEATMMAVRLWNIQRWSEEDDKLLRSMSKSGKSLTLMVVKLNRSMTSIKSRAQDIGVTIPGTEICKGRHPKRG